MHPFGVFTRMSRRNSSRLKAVEFAFMSVGFLASIVFTLHYRNQVLSKLSNIVGQLPPMPWLLLLALAALSGISALLSIHYLLRHISGN